MLLTHAQNTFPFWFRFRPNKRTDTSGEKPKRLQDFAQKLFCLFIFYFFIIILIFFFFSFAQKPQQFSQLGTRRRRRRRRKEKVSLIDIYIYIYKMYPKVKVRQQQQDQDDHHVFPDFSSPEEHEEDTFVPSIAKVPKSYIPNIAVSPSNDMPKLVSMPKISVLKEAEQDNREADDEDGKQHLRACSIPRPRAVLSSPDNDMVIGNRNRGKMERSSVLKNRKLPQNRHAQCKVIPNTTEDSVKAKKSKEDRDQNESNLKGSKGSLTACPMPRRQIRAGKPAPKRT